MIASYHKHILQFKKPSGTSRGILKTKETWYLVIKENTNQGIGECGLLRSLSIDDRPDYEEKLKWVCENITIGLDLLLQELIEFPSIQFGVEMAFASLYSKDPFVLFPSLFTKGNASILINGLIWMGDQEYMSAQIEEKLSQGFNCIKLKIGAIDFDKEYELLKALRNRFPSDKIEIRVDANGAFDPKEAIKILDKLQLLDIHSIEQPIRKGQVDKMKRLCVNSALPIALDEELIGVFDVMSKKKLLQNIMPNYIILKPSLIGGFKGTKEWIILAESLGIGWWITSALESNIGLNAIAQFTFDLGTEIPQGLGTGGLYDNNIESPLEIKNGTLNYNPIKEWGCDLLN